jgi:hypothetical protein
MFSKEALERAKQNVRKPELIGRGLPKVDAGNHQEGITAKFSVS